MGSRRGDAQQTAQREREKIENLLSGGAPWPRALQLLGLLCVEAGALDHARSALEEALAVDPSLPLANQVLQRLS